MKIKPGSIVRYKHLLRGYYIVVEVAGSRVKTYNVKTGSVTPMTVMFLRSEFLFL
tara:strand:- start:265 stop:429 length:165 start_codon:yes stop_codon:yes gene_type:complete